MASIKIKNGSICLGNIGGESRRLKYFILDKIKKNSDSPDKKKQYILNNFNFEAKDGDRIGLYGPNGAGKSTILKVISGIYPLTSGSVEVHGKLFSLLELGAGFNDDLTGRENIQLMSALYGLSSTEVQAIEGDIIDFSGLSNHIDFPIRNYSSGMRQRLAFSVASSFKPEILILDEVFAAGDVAFVEKAKERMNEMIDQCNILIMTSHDQKLLEQICNKLVPVMPVNPVL